MSMWTCEEVVPELLQLPIIMHANQFREQLRIFRWHDLQKLVWRYYRIHNRRLNLHHWTIDAAPLEKRHQALDNMSPIAPMSKLCYPLDHRVGRLAICHAI